MYEYRQILAADLPRSTNFDGTLRELNEQDLLNFGLVRVDGNIYLCVGAFPDGRGQYTDPAQLPGTLIARGYRNQRHLQLPALARRRILRARLFRHLDPAVSLRHLVNDNLDPDRLRAEESAEDIIETDPARRGKIIEVLRRARWRARRRRIVGEQEIEVPPLEEGPDIIEPEAAEMFVPLIDIQDGDVVVRDRIIPVSFAGEELVRG